MPVRMTRCLGVVVIALGSGPLALARQPDPAVLRHEMGFQGRFKVGQWMPVTLVVEARQEPFTGALEVLAPDSDDMTVVYAQPLRLAMHRPAVVRLVMRMRRSRQGLLCRFVHDDGRLASTAILQGRDGCQGIEPAQRLLLLVGQAAGLVETLQQSRFREQCVSAEITDPDGLPDRWVGYEGVDTAVWVLAEPGTDQDLWGRLSAPQRQALKEWVGMGGRLVIAPCAAPALTADAERGFGDLWPAPIREVNAVHPGSSLESFAETGEVFPTTPRLPVAFLNEAAEAPVRALCRLSGKWPLVASRPYRFGLVTVLAFDVTQRPFADWNGRADFWIKLLGLKGERTPGQPEAAAHRQAVTREAFTDLAIDLKAHLDHFDDVSLVPFGLVAVFLFLYILLIGPVDYFFLKFAWRRLERTWLTFPVIVAAVSLGAYETAARGKGDRMRARQVVLVDEDPASGVGRGILWSTLFSPRHEAYTITTSQPGAIVSWLGKPTTSLGGFLRQGGTEALQGAYRQGPSLDRLVGVPLRVWSTKSFEARWSEAARYPIRAHLRTPGGLGQTVVGELRNETALDLEDACLAYGRRLYLLGSWPAGRAVRLPPRSRDLASWLERRRDDLLIVEDAAPEGDRYRPATHDTDPTEPLHLMMFYDRVPRRRLQLPEGLVRSGQFAALDESLQLDHGRAVLVARALLPDPRQGPHLRVEGWDGDGLESRFYLRVILPVQ